MGAWGRRGRSVRLRQHLGDAAHEKVQAAVNARKADFTRAGQRWDVELQLDLSSNCFRKSQLEEVMSMLLGWSTFSCLTKSSLTKMGLSKCGSTHDCQLRKRTNNM